MSGFAKTEIERFLYRVGSEVVNEAKEIAPRQTSNLARDIQVVRTAKNEVVIGNTKLAEYALFVHNGTKPHTIKAKNKKALKTPFGYKKSVKHPGTKANPYLLNALKSYTNSSQFARASVVVLDDIGLKLKLDIEKNWNKE